MEEIQSNSHLVFLVLLFSSFDVQLLWFQPTYLNVNSVIIVLGYFVSEKY
jgi:hypothetical protein